MKKDLISTADLTAQDLRFYLDLARRVEDLPPERKRTLLAGRILMVLFYEPSTRTRLSFEAAMLRLGGGTMGFSEAASTSVAKGESLRDTIRTVENYADILVIRHPREGAARLAAEASQLPVVNAGDGANQHPTQMLLDLYTLQQCMGRVDGLRIALVGDLKYSRTIHSLVKALALFEDVRFHLVSPSSLRLPDYLREGVRGEESEDLASVIPESDVVYMTRIQRERFPDDLEYEKVKDVYRLDARMLAGAPPHLRVLHPLPRVNEIAPDVDATPHAAFFPQVAHGVTMRQAVLLHLLGVTP